MSTRIIFSIVLLICTSAAHLKARPGEVVEAHFPKLTSTASVIATAIAPDQSVFILGDFTEVNGVSRPGLAKLQNNGLLDPSFDPKMSVEQSPYTNPRKSDTYSLRPLYFPKADLFALNEGRLLIRNRTAWEILSADGSISAESFPNFPRNEVAPVPQFLSGDRLILLTNENNLVALDLTNGDQIDLTFQLDSTLEGNVIQAISDGHQKIWTLSQRGLFQVICRLNLNGSIDNSFPPLELRGFHTVAARLEPAYGGGFAVTTKQGFFLSSLFYPLRSQVHIEWFSNLGVSQTKVTLLTNLFTLTPFKVHPWSRVTHFDSLSQKWVNLHGSSGPIELDNIQVASPNHPSHLPRAVSRIDLMRGTISSSLFRKLLIGGTRRFYTDGTIDETWNVPRLSRLATEIKAKKLPDGSFLASGNFNQADGIPCRGMVKIAANGSLDSSFTPDLDLRFVHDFKLDSIGQIYVHLTEPWTSSNGDSTSLLRLNHEGHITRAYSTGEPIAQFILLKDDSIIFQAKDIIFPPASLPDIPLRPSQTLSFWPTRLYRITPSGELDSDWELHRLGDETTGSWASGALLALNDGSFFWGENRFQSNGQFLDHLGNLPCHKSLTPLYQAPDDSVYFVSRFSNPSDCKLIKWHPTTGIDQNFLDSFQDSKTTITGITSTTQNKLLVWGNLHTPSDGRQVARLHSTGQLDYTFEMPPLENNTYLPSSEHILTCKEVRPYDPAEFTIPSSFRFACSQGDTLLIAGDFNLPQSNFLRVSDSHISGYRDWILATTDQFIFPDSDTLHESQQPHEDFDHDGCSNLEEYAAGSDPARSDARACALQMISTKPMVFQVPCNPEAPEVSRTVEVSNKMSDWRIAQADEIIRETTSECFTFRLTNPKDRLFARVIYSLP